MSNKVLKQAIILMLTVVLGCGGAAKFKSVEQILADNGVSVSTANNFIVYNDNSCDLCVKNLAYYIQHLPARDFTLLYTTKSTKATYENSIIKELVPKEKFRLVNNMALFDELARITNDYKGIYLLSVKGNHISNVEPIVN